MVVVVVLEVAFVSIEPELGPLTLSSFEGKDDTELVTVDDEEEAGDRCGGVER